MRTNTTILTAITLVAVVGAGGALAGENEASHHDDGFEGRHGKDHFDGDLHVLTAAGPRGTFGMDSDGGHARAGIETLRNNRLAAHDGNGDGNLSLEEFAALWHEATRRTTVRAFQLFDVNGDAIVTQEEYDQRLANFVRRRDYDGD